MLFRFNNRGMLDQGAALIRNKKPLLLGRDVAGFSLVELLTAASISSVLLLLIFNLISSGSKTITGSKNTLEAYSQMRMVLGRMDFDLSRALWREDTNPQFKASNAFSVQPGNDSILFISHVDGYGGDRNLSVVGYRLAKPEVDSGMAKCSLLRGVSGSYCAGGSGIQFTFGYDPNNSASLTPIKIDDSNYESMADLIVRMEICFVDRQTGKISKTVPASIGSVKSIIVTLAAVDGNVLKRVNSPQVLLDLAKLLNDSQSDNERPIIGWQAQADSAATQAGQIRMLLEHLRLMQREFYVAQ